MTDSQPRLLSTYLTNNQEHATMRSVGVRDDHQRGARRIQDSTMQADPQGNPTPHFLRPLALALLAAAEESVARAPTRRTPSRKTQRASRIET